MENRYNQGVAKRVQVLARPAILTLVVSTACSHAGVGDQSLPKKGRDYQVTNLGPQFKAFWQRARDLPFAEQIVLWNRIIEQPHQELYDSVVWEKGHRDNWKAIRAERLQRNFALYADHYAAISRAFDTFAATVEEQRRRFTREFADARFRIQVYAIPSPTFNGKNSFLGGDPNRPILAFGLDRSLFLGDDPEVLYAHELFHVYHLDKMQEAIAADLMHDAPLTLALWTEGLATFVSQRMNPEATLEAVLMSEELARVAESDVDWLATRFLQDADVTASDPDGAKRYWRWFGSKGEHLREDLPNRCGYLLGLRIVEQIARETDLDEMLHWNLTRIHAAVLEALRTRGGEIENRETEERP